MSRVKIVGTIGPRTNTAPAIEQLCQAGMDLARLNTSHASLEWHAETIRVIRRVAPMMPILLDIPGRKIRTGFLRHEPRFKVGDQVVLTTNQEHDGTFKVPVSHSRLHEELCVGDTVLADDGQLRFTVEAVTGQDVLCRAETTGLLQSAKGINIPGVALRTELITERDLQVLELARQLDVEFVGVSFVESAAHVQTIRRAIGGASPRVIAKVEHQSGVDHLEEILQVSDAIMIDRGDLSVETGLHSVAILQKRILTAARAANKPAIVATEMLHSMVRHRAPTKAEISDITNAVLDGAAAVMLSGETAIGQYPVEAVATMRQVIDEAAAHLQSCLDEGQESRSPDVPHAMGSAIALLCRQLPVTKIVAITLSGYAARMVASQRPRQPVLAVTNDPVAARSFQLLPGTEGICIDVPFSRTSTDHIPRCLEMLWRTGKLMDEDLILVTSVGYPRHGTRMNLIQTHQVADLRESLRWNRS